MRLALDDDRAPPWAARAVLAIIAAAAVTWSTLAILRFATFHNETFDLAFYVRMAWGLARGIVWDPIVDAHVLGLHLSPVLAPLGLIGWIPGALPPVLLAVQAVCLAGAAWPLARLAARRLGGAGAVAVTAAWVLHPNTGHVATTELHPGTLAVLPLAWAIDAIDRGAPRELLGAAAAVLACREDLGLTLAAIGLVALASRPAPPLRAAARWVLWGGLAWVALFAAVLHPIFGPRVGSMQLHFGEWGDSAGQVLLHLATHPADLAAHLGAPARAWYPAALLAPLAFLPLAAPRWIVAALPTVGVNLLSQFPTTLGVDEHYLTPALPALFAAAVEGARRVGDALAPRAPVAAPLAAWLAAAFGAQLVAGALPFGGAFDAGAFRPDARTHAARAAVALIPRDASVQAPDALLPHLAEREWVHRLPPPERGVDFVVFDAWFRDVHRSSEDLLRTEEEPYLRTWLARDDHTVIATPGPFLVLARGAPAARAVGRDVVEARGRPVEGLALTDCLHLRAATLVRGVAPADEVARGRPDLLTLRFVAAGPCPADLALRLGTGHRPARVDLLFDGRLAPPKLAAGDAVVSRHALTPAERRRIEALGLRVGLVRSSGARPSPGDPTAVDVPLAGDGPLRWTYRLPSAEPSTP